MSHRGLQRALVVALHDPGFVAAARAAPERELARFDLTPSERAALLAVDPRAFTVDRLRARRLLRALVEELPAATAIALAETRALAFADGFFAAPEFRDAVIGDRPLVFAYAAYLAAAAASGRIRAPQLGGVLAIEVARARARRSLAAPVRAGIAPAPGVVPVATTTAALASLQLLEQHLFEVGLMPHVALVDDRPPVPSLPIDGEPLWLLVRAGGAGGADLILERIDAPLHRALDALAAATVPLDPEAAARIVGGLGLPLRRPTLLIDQLLDAGLLRRGDPCV